MQANHSDVPRTLTANQSGSAVPWIIGGLAAAGVVYWLTRPAKATTKTATGPLPPPPTPLPGPATCAPTPELLAAFGNANGIEIFMNSPNGLNQLTAGPLDPNKPQLTWNPGESVLRTPQGNQIEPAGTQAFCAYASGQSALQCSLSGASFSKFTDWAFKAYAANAFVHILEYQYPPPTLETLNKSTFEGGMTSPGTVPFTEDNTLLVTRAPYEMVWRYYQGQPTQAPEIVKAYCDAVAAGTVQGPRRALAHPALGFVV